MATDHILALLISERNKLTKAIEALQGPTEQKAVPVAAAPRAALPAVSTVSKPAKRKLSAAGRRAIIEGTKKRWAAFNAAKAGAAAPVAVTPKTAPAKIPAAAKASPAKNAAFRKKMSERMKAAWAARKKKAGSKTK
jgi:hypothetical protein